MELGVMFFASVGDADARTGYSLLFDVIARADAAGLRAIWTPERHFHRFGGLFPNPAVISAAIAMQTDRIEIRAGSVISPLHSPIRVAEEWSVVDNLSDGRVSIAFGSGWNVDDFVLAPDSYDDRRERMLRQVETVRRLWRGEAIEMPANNGQTVNVWTLPRPVQPELPVWLTAGGTNDDTFLEAAGIGAGVLTHLMSQDIDTLAGRIERYRSAGGTRPVAVMLHTYVAGAGEDGASLVRGPMRDYLREAFDLDARALTASGRSVNRDPQLIEELLETVTERYLSQALIGDAARCRVILDRLALIGVDEVACLIDFGVDAAHVCAGVERLADLRHSS